MKFSQSLLALTGLAAAMAAPTTTSDETTTYEIDDFTLRKTGDTINTAFFNIKAINGGTLDFECAPYDPAIGGTTSNFEAGHVYACGNNSFFSFAFDPATDTSDNELYLWQEISEADGNTISGRTSITNPICRAGGAGPDDFVCTVPQQAYTTITLSRQ